MSDLLIIPIWLLHSSQYSLLDIKNIKNKDETFKQILLMPLVLFLYLLDNEIIKKYGINIFTYAQIE